VAREPLLFAREAGHGIAGGPGVDEDKHQKGGRGDEEQEPEAAEVEAALERLGGLGNGFDFHSFCWVIAGGERRAAPTGESIMYESC
jgi:hypothetical protein